jgi:LPXTG-site transpeptidase (sortase) family protein
LSVIRRLVCLAATSVLAAGLVLVPALASSVEPPSATLQLEPGGSVTIQKQVTAPEPPPLPVDIYFVSDTTGSMESVIGAARENARDVVDEIVALYPGAQFGVGNYRDFPSPEVFRNQQSITANTSAVKSRLGNWWAEAVGGDIPEGQFYALHRIATNPALNWRPGSSRVVVWYGDAPGHDPVPTEATGLGFDITEAVVTDSLVSAGIRVIAVNLDTGESPGGLNGNPLFGGGGYTEHYGTVENGTPGQANRIASATGGLVLTSSSSTGIVNTIVAGLAGLDEPVDAKVDVWPTVQADPGLSVTFDPVVHMDCDPGTTVTFAETISVATDVQPGTVLNAVVTFWGNTYPQEGSPIGQQVVTVTAPSNGAPPPGPDDPAPGDPDPAPDPEPDPAPDPEPQPTAEPGEGPAGVPAGADAVVLPPTGLGPDSSIRGLLLWLSRSLSAEEGALEVRVADALGPTLEPEPERGPEPLADQPSYGVPLRLRIPSIKVDAPVVSVGLTSDGQMEAPEGANATGWYALGSRPGEPGSAVIAGHSGYRTGPAVFDNLGQLRAGDRIYVLDAEGTSITFEVRGSRQYDPGSKPKEVFLAGEARDLNLVTCAGEWDRAAAAHTKRLVVFARVVAPPGD